jgi:peptidoglycan/LPS O-acetylase OafA/YrhL
MRPGKYRQSGLVQCHSYVNIGSKMLNSKPHASGQTYRSDIDGLRAIAVLAVVLYHYGVPGISGGFVGVDVFYVISGFLITGLIQSEIESGRFTFTGFYDRRIRRIFPALFVVLASTFAAGAYILLPTDLVLLGKSTISTLLFSSNIFFWRTSGYFDGSSELNPLLHTWSLAVEEQFYIGLPVLLILIYRYTASSLKPVLILLITASFAICLWQQSIRPSASFYLTPFRAWELLLGSYLAVGGLEKIKQPLARELLALLGLGILIIGITMIKAGPGFPGWLALLPVIGTALLLHAMGSGNTQVGNLLSSAPFVFVGLISYSLYLWHWPVLVFIKYTQGANISVIWKIAGILISLALATLSYRFIEQPFRINRILFPWKKLALLAFVSTFLLMCVGTSFILGKGFEGRFPSAVVKLDAERRPTIPFVQCEGKSNLSNIYSDKCILGDDSKPFDIAVWGDSHALAWAPGLDLTFSRAGRSGILFFHSGCPPLSGVSNPASPSCSDWNTRILQSITLNSQIKTVVLMASWFNYSNESGAYSLRDASGRSGNEAVFSPALYSTVRALLDGGLTVWIVGPLPYAPVDAPFSLAMNKIRPGHLPPDVAYDRIRSDARNFFDAVDALRDVNGLLISNPLKWLCSETTCRYQTDGMPIYRDAWHLSSNGSRMLANRLTEEFEKLVIIEKQNREVKSNAVSH